MSDLVAVIANALGGMGVAGGIIAALLLTIVSMSGVIVAQWKHSNKVYGYRLAERDTLNKTLNDSTSALHGMLRGLDDRNEITEEQAELIQKQSAAFEILRVMLLAQYENTEKEIGHLAQVTGAISESLRIINSMMLDSKNATVNHVTELKHAMVSSNQSLVTELRNLIGNESTIITRRRKPT